MTVNSAADVYYDPWDPATNADPYPTWRRLREEAPLYYNEQHDFYALSRFDDVERALIDRETYISSRGVVLEMIQAGVSMPRGFFISEDDPLHRLHRKVVSRLFSPKAISELEPKIREYCARSLDPLVGAGGFDFMADIGAQMPMRVIGMLLGVPEDAQELIRDGAIAALHTEPGEQMPYDDLDSPDNILASMVRGDMFADYIDWREEHPADDLMTDLMQAEFEDETGTTRRLRRDELLAFVGLLGLAGNETTSRLITWVGKLLGDHADQRRDIVEDRSLVPNAIEEILRYESPAAFFARYMTKDVEWYGRTVPAGSAMVVINGSGNRDDRRFPDGDRFDVHREISQILSFGYGAHYCLGAALARLEGRIALEEILNRFPEWEVDTVNAKQAVTSTARGWDALPVIIP
jgi:cytochrome P450